MVLVGMHGFILQNHDSSERGGASQLQKQSAHLWQGLTCSFQSYNLQE